MTFPRATGHEYRLLMGYANAQFGGMMEIWHGKLVEAEPRLADTPLRNAAAVSGKVALVHRDPP